MIQTFSIVAVAGFSLAAVLAAGAVVMFFALHVKEVRDELTGKTAARSIAEIRSRAKTRKRCAGVSSGDLSDFADAEAWRDTAELPDDARGAAAVEDEGATTFLSDDEGGTTVLADDGPATTLLAGDAHDADDQQDDEDDGPATTLLSHDDATASTGGAR